MVFFFFLFFTFFYFNSQLDPLFSLFLISFFILIIFLFYPSCINVSHVILSTLVRSRSTEVSQEWSKLNRPWVTSVTVLTTGSIPEILTHLQRFPSPQNLFLGGVYSFLHSFFSWQNQERSTFDGKGTDLWDHTRMHTPFVIHLLSSVKFTLLLLKIRCLTLCVT